MAANKYGKYIVQVPLTKEDIGPSFRWDGETAYHSNFSLVTMLVTKPVEMEKIPHYHDFDMYLYFFSFDPNNLDDLGAEIEMGFGKEREMHKITKPCSVYVPKGTIHCPLNFIKVTRPIFFVHPSLTAKYTKVEV